MDGPQQEANESHNEGDEKCISKNDWCRLFGESVCVKTAKMLVVPLVGVGTAAVLRLERDSIRGQCVAKRETGRRQLRARPPRGLFE